METCSCEMSSTPPQTLNLKPQTVRVLAQPLRQSSKGHARQAAVKAGTAASEKSFETWSTLLGGVYIRDFKGTATWVVMGDTRSLDHSSFDASQTEGVCPEPVEGYSV